MDAPSSLWIVLDPKAGPEFAAAWREGAHEHIKDCLDGGTNEAARWVVREYVPADEITRLRAEVEAERTNAALARAFHDVAVQQRNAAWSESDRLRAEVEALRADAARYRWLRKYAGRGAAGSIFDHFSGTAIDECIDAARTAQGGEHG